MIQETKMLLTAQEYMICVCELLKTAQEQMALENMTSEHMIRELHELQDA